MSELQTSADVVDVSVIIVTHNHAEQASAVIRCFLRYPGSEIILVDNASSEAVVDTIAGSFQGITIVRNLTNLGFGAANNIGAKRARGRYLLFANADIFVDNNPLPGMMAMLQNSNDIGIVGVQLYNSDGSKQPSYFRFPSLWLRFLQLSGLKSAILSFQPSSRKESSPPPFKGFVSGAFFMIDRNLFLKVGGFDDAFFMYVEDADLGYRVYRAGMRSVILGKSNVVHFGKNYEDENNPFVFFHMNFGLLLFFQKNYPRWRSVALILLSIPFYGAKIAGLSLKATNSEIRSVYEKLLRIYVSSLFGHVRKLVNNHPL